MKISCKNFNLQSVCIENDQISEVNPSSNSVNLINDTSKIGLFVSVLVKNFLEDQTANHRIEGLAILFKAFVQAKEHQNGSCCASSLRGKLEELALIYPDSIRKVMEKPEYIHNDYLGELIERITYLTKPKFFNGFSLFGTRFSYHISNQLGVFTTTVKTSAVAVGGLLLLVNGIQVMVPTQQDVQIAEGGYGLGALQMTIGSTFFAANIVGSILKTRHDSSVSKENSLPEEKDYHTPERSSSCVTIVVAEAEEPRSLSSTSCGSNSPMGRDPSSPVANIVRQPPSSSGCVRPTPFAARLGRELPSLDSRKEYGVIDV